MQNTDYQVALAVPVYNEEETVELFVTTIEEKLASLKGHLSIVFIDDGSKDRTRELIVRLSSEKREIPVSLIALSRNFGKEAAMSAALDLIEADAIVPMDVDLQDPPELVLKFVQIWREEGVDSVYGVRVDRSSDTDMKRFTSGGFYRVFNRVSSRVKIPENAGDFRLIDKKVVATVRALHESNRFMKGLFAWPGFTSCGVPYRRPERAAGTTKWNYWKLWNFALDGIIAFSSLPLRVWSYIGAGVGLGALIYMLYILIDTMVTGIDAPGYASLMCVVLFLGSVQLISIGVLGEYLGRMSEEVKHRPVYVVSAVRGPLAGKLAQGIVLSGNGLYVNEAEQDPKQGERDA